MAGEGDKNVISASEEQKPQFKVRTIEVKKGFACDIGRTHHTASFGITVDVYDGNFASYTTMCETFCDGRLEQTLKDLLAKSPTIPSRTSTQSPQEPLPFDIETLHFNQSIRKPDLWLTSRDCETFRQVMDYIKEHGPIQLHGFTYCIMPDEITIGRRKVQ